MKNDTIVIWDDYRSIFLSLDYANSWELIRGFEKGRIVEFFFEGSKITSFNNLGQISISNDFGKKWEEMSDLQDTLLSVLKLDDGYLVRLDDKLVLLTDDFQIKKESLLRADYSSYELTPSVEGYRTAMTKFKDNFIISTFGFKLIVFNHDLIPLDTIDLNERGLCDIDTNIFDSCFFMTPILSDNDYIYINSSYSILKSQDLQIFDKIYTSESPVSKWKLVDGTLYYWNAYVSLKFELYKITPDSLQTIAKYKGIEKIYNNEKLSPNAYTFDKDRVIVVGADKLIIIHDIKKDTTELVSYFTSHSRSLLPDAINDSTFLFYSGFKSTNKNYGQYSPVLYKTDDMGLTFKYSINLNNNPDIWGFSYSPMNYKYFDNDKKLLYLGGWDTYHHDTGGFLVTGDYGNTFDFIPVPNLGFQAREVPNLQRKDNYFITSESYSHPITKKHYSYVFTFDNNFAMVDSFSFYNYIVRHQHSYDANSFLFLSENKLDSINEINYTTDKGKNFEVIKGYSKHDNLLYYHDYVTKDINYLYMCFYNVQDSVIRFEALNIDDRTVHLIYSSKALPDEVDDLKANTAFYGEGDEFYLSVRDTLFHIDDIYASKHTKFNILPNNGRIKRTLKKFGNTYYVYYKDDKNRLNLYWMKLDSNNTSVEYEVENKNYLYSYPPYPLPAMNEVRSLIYWDTSKEIDIEQIAVYNLYGAKVAGHDKIRLDKLNAYSGNLVWDCSGVESGIYVIHLKHGTESRIIKVIVTK